MSANSRPENLEGLQAWYLEAAETVTGQCKGSTYGAKWHVVAGKRTCAWPGLAAETQNVHAVAECVAGPGKQDEAREHNGGVRSPGTQELRVSQSRRRRRKVRPRSGRRRRWTWQRRSNKGAAWKCSGHFGTEEDAQHGTSLVAGSCCSKKEALMRARNSSGHDAPWS